MVQIVIVKERLQEVFDSDPRTDTDIAQAFGVSKQTISAWKNGSRSPKKSKLEEIAKYYKKNVAWFFDMEETKNSPLVQADVDERTAEFISLLQNLSEKKRDAALQYIRYLADGGEDE